jgi:hypothetical protein
VDGLRRPQPLERALLDDPEQLALQIKGKLGDFIEKDGRPVGNLEPAGILVMAPV